MCVFVCVALCVYADPIAKQMFVCVVMHVSHFRGSTVQSYARALSLARSPAIGLRMSMCLLVCLSFPNLFNMCVRACALRVGACVCMNMHVCISTLLCMMCVHVCAFVRVCKFNCKVDAFYHFCGKVQCIVVRLRM